jgi:hypothetical protein
MSVNMTVTERGSGPGVQAASAPRVAVRAAPSGTAAPGHAGAATEYRTAEDRPAVVTRDRDATRDRGGRGAVA